MGAALEIVSGTATAPGAAFTADTPAPGNSFQVRSAAINSQVRLVQAWGFYNVTGSLRIRSPRLHDVNQGIRIRVAAALSLPRYPGYNQAGWGQPLIPQDVLIVDTTGSATAGQIEAMSMMIYYANLPGVSARLISPAQVQQFGVNLMSQEVSITTTTVAGYTGQVAVNSLVDNFKANTDYALLGGLVDTRAGSIRIQGVDVGNLGVGFPAEPTAAEETATHFMNLSNAFGLPLVPVFNSANKFNILVDALGNQAAITTVVTLHFVEMTAGSVPGALQGTGA